MDALTSSKADTIRQLNDRARKHFLGCSVMLTAGVDALPLSTKASVLHMVRMFDDFDGANDPYNEHDLGGFDFNGERYLWKIDYYAPDMERGSEDPSDPAKTRRVLTIMHAREY